MRTATATIAASASLSGAIAVEGDVLRGIQLPSSWTTADLSLQVSVDGGTTYADLFESSGDETTIPAAASRYVRLNLPLLGVTNLKVRSGSTASAVTQSAARSLVLVLEHVG